MTFEEWFQRFGLDNKELKTMALLAWEAGQKAGQKEEREALCAGLMQAHEEVKGTHNYYQVAADKLRREEPCRLKR